MVSFVGSESLIRLLTGQFEFGFRSALGAVVVCGFCLSTLGVGVVAVVHASELAIAFHFSLLSFGAFFELREELLLLLQVGLGFGGGILHCL